MSPPAVFLDACVLYPDLVRGIVMGCAERGLIRPRWSARVLDEWTIAAARNNGPQTEDAVREARRDMASRFPDALVPADPDVEAGLHLPDPADNHVAAAAQAADVLLTFNLRDFPRRAVAGLNVTVRHPDAFLWETWSHQPGPVEAAIRAALDGVGVAWEHRRGVLKRARLSRLGKAVTGKTG